MTLEWENKSAEMSDHEVWKSGCWTVRTQDGLLWTVWYRGIWNYEDIQLSTARDADEGKLTAQFMDLVMGRDYKELIVLILRELRERPATRGKHFFDELILNIENLDWSGK